MKAFTPIRRLVMVAVAGLASLLLIVVLAPTAHSQERRCVVLPVVGLTVQEASLALRNSGCRPGNARDGRHFVIRASSCYPAASFGRIMAQTPTGGRLGKKQLLVLTKAIRPLTGANCDSIDVNAGQHVVGDLDGTYDAVYTITGGTDAVAIPGRQVEGISFTVANGRITGGDVRGNITWNANGATGVAANATGDFAGSICNGTLTFAFDVQGRATVSGNGIVCDDGGFVGNLAGRAR